MEAEADRKAKLGQRWVCFKCGLRFYDLNKPEPLCPKCAADQRESPEFQKPTKKRSTKKASKKTVAAAPPPEAEEEREDDFSSDDSSSDLEELDDLELDDSDDDSDVSLEVEDD